MPRIALGLEYDGAAFCGWQTQPGACGVQDHLQHALSRFVAAPVEVTAAGRTDAGVHATAQVVHFDAAVERDEISWVRGTNSSLHESARVLWARAVAADFHARYSAASRTYRYLLSTTPVPPAILRGRVGWYLDRRSTSSSWSARPGPWWASTTSRAFRDAQCQAKSPLRNLVEGRVERDRGSLPSPFAPTRSCTT